LQWLVLRFGRTFDLDLIALVAYLTIISHIIVYISPWDILKSQVHMALCVMDAFLIEACRNGHGDIKKRINVVEICKTTSVSLSDQEVNSQILRPLLIKGNIKNYTKDEVVVTRKGYYYAIRISGESAANFGMVSYNEAKRLSFGTLKYVCKRIHCTKTEPKINILKIKPGGHEGALDSYGNEVNNQIAEILGEYGFITFMGDTGEIDITTKGVEEVIRRVMLQKYS
jgi:hypothetical protein